MSYTLIMHGIDPKTVGTACATCDNAVWRAIKGVENSDFTEFFPLNYRENDTKIGCWCTVFHCYIQTMTTCCDGNVPKDAPGLNDMLKNK